MMHTSKIDWRHMFSATKYNQNGTGRLVGTRIVASSCSYRHRWINWNKRKKSYGENSSPSKALTFFRRRRKLSKYLKKSTKSKDHLYIKNLWVLLPHIDRSSNSIGIILCSRVVPVLNTLTFQTIINWWNIAKNTNSSKDSHIISFQPNKFPQCFPLLRSHIPTCKAKTTL